MNRFQPRLKFDFNLPVPFDMSRIDEFSTAHRHQPIDEGYNEKKDDTYRPASVEVDGVGGESVQPREEETHRALKPRQISVSRVKHSPQLIYIVA